MGLRERQHEKVDRRTEQFLRDELHPEEVIEAVTTGQVRPRGWFGLELLFGVRRSVHARTDGCCSTCGGSVAVRRSGFVLSAAPGVPPTGTEVARVVREARGGLPG